MTHKISPFSALDDTTVKHDYRCHLSPMDYTKTYKDVELRLALALSITAPQFNWYTSWPKLSPIVDTPLVYSSCDGWINPTLAPFPPLSNIFHINYFGYGPSYLFSNLKSK